MHICYCHKQLQKPRVSTPLLLSGGGLCAVCRVVTRRTWLPLDRPGGLQSQLGEGLPVLVTVSLREERRGRGKETSGVAATLKWGRRVEPSAARCHSCSGLARTLLRTVQNPGRGRTVL